MLPSTPGVVIASHGRRVLRHATAVALCALVAHTVAYGSLVPDDGAHGYFAWYAPLVGVLSALSILVTALALLVALVSRPGSRLDVAIKSVLPTRSADRSVFAELFRLAAATLVFLSAQESLERSLSAGRPELVSFAPSTLVLLITAVLVAAAAIALVEHALRSLTEVVLRAARATDRKRLPRPERPAHLARRARLRPLAVHGGLRAPPLLA